MSDTKVPKGNKNCWTCPSCDQYNGFDTDGDYNIPIPSQFDENMNYGIGAIKRKEYSSNPDLHFCNLCLDKQTRKIELLNKFNFKNDRFNEQDYFNYKTSLEQQFKLCFSCQTRVNDQINLKNNEILPDYIEWSAQQKRKKMNQEKRKYSLIKQLNILPVIMIITCLLIQIVVYANHFLNIENSILNILIQHQNKLNIINFLVVFIGAKFGNLRPSIAFSNLQLLLIVLIILYNYLIDLEINNKLLKLPILLTLTCLFIRIIWKFILIIQALSYSKYSLVSISPTKQNEKLVSNNLKNRFIQNEKSVLNNSEYSNGTFPSQSNCANLIESVINRNVKCQPKTNFLLKPSKLNFVKIPQTSLLNSKSISTLKDFDKSKKTTSICSRSLSNYNFESASQCLRSTNHSTVESSFNNSKSSSIYSGRNSNSFISANSRMCHDKPKEISCNYWKILFKYVFGALFGIGLNLIIILLLTHFNVDNFKEKLFL